MLKEQQAYKQSRFYSAEAVILQSARVRTEAAQVDA